LIAFNFTIGSDLPRLGYLTFLDAILIIAFIITALTVICNVALKRTDAAGRSDVAENIDRYIIYILRDKNSSLNFDFFCHI
jgi:hypothetical protein